MHSIGRKSAGWNEEDGNDNCGSDLIVTPSGLEIQGTAREQTVLFFKYYSALYESIVIRSL